MTATALLASDVSPEPSPPQPQRPDVQRIALEDAIALACRRIAPLWPLKHFVAVNPFLGFTGQSFGATCALMQRVTHARMLMPRSFYREAIEKGEIDDTALQEAIDGAAESVRQRMDLAALKAAAGTEPDAQRRPEAVVATVAEILDRLSGGDRHASHVAFMIDEISRFCAAYFDDGQASWPLPWRKLPLYRAWRESLRHDRSAEALGIRNFSKVVLALSEDPAATIGQVVAEAGIPHHAIEDYLHRALFDIGGWAAHARQLSWNAELHGSRDDTLVDLLALRIAWGWGLFRARTDAPFKAAWAEAMTNAAKLPRGADTGIDEHLGIDLLLQEAYEASYRRRLAAKLTDRLRTGSVQRPPHRPAAQVVFCIDVRSEVFRRALETTWPEVETSGFAGFFGIPIEYVRLGHETGGAHCPVLLKPAFVVREVLSGACEREAAEMLGSRIVWQRAMKLWKTFKVSAVSSFSFVEAAGLLFGCRLASDSLGLTTPDTDPAQALSPRHAHVHTAPQIAPATLAGRATGMAHEDIVDTGEAVLKAMGLTNGFARLVLLAGHGSTTANNPYASGLDCGACGGHTGEASARVAAGILNDPGVRHELAARGIAIPEDCWFLAALHDTTTDDVRIFDEDAVPQALAADLAQLTNALANASVCARRERSAALGITSHDQIETAIQARSRDWSQVRPEWGLAGNAAFIAAPRPYTRGLDLGGRAFLHDYDAERDPDNATLELIMTAPMVVASWINLQYYGSSVDNQSFGSGNKVLHNVVGQLGVLEGNAGDLRVGLPWQSVHDGRKLVHEPMRLNVFIAASRTAMDGVIARHDNVRDLAANGWVHLHALEPQGDLWRFVGPGNWQRV